MTSQDSAQAFEDISKELDDYVNELKSKLPQDVAPTPRMSFTDPKAVAAALQEELEDLDKTRYKLAVLREEVLDGIAKVEIRMDAVAASLKIYNK